MKITMKCLKIWRFVPVMSLVFSACSDYLTVVPDNRTVEEGYYNSAQRVEQAVVGGYVDLRRALIANHAWLMYGEARAGDLVVAAAAQPYVARQELTTAHDNLEDLTDWGYFYDVINSANDVLVIVNEADSDILSDYQRNLYKGEALALKSIAYFYLARVWGDVPSAESADKGQNPGQSATVERAAGYAREALGLLPWLLLNDDGIESAALSAIRFTKTSAIMLLAQQELWLGNGQEAYSVLGQAFTDNAPVTLPGFGLSMGEDRRTPISRAPLAGSLVRMPLVTLNNIYPAGDGRRARLFTISEAQGFATLILRDQTVLDLFKVSELGLLQAEAAWRSGRMDEAREYLVNATSGATEDYNTLSDADFEEALLLERQRLLVGTGQRFFDMIRFDKVSRFVPVLDESAVQQGAAYWPLSARSISGNSLSQNSYWSN